MPLKASDLTRGSRVNLFRVPEPWARGRDATVRRVVDDDVLDVVVDGWHWVLAEEYFVRVIHCVKIKDEVLPGTLGWYWYEKRKKGEVK